MEERWRLFVAIAISDEVRRAIQLAQVAARRAGFTARWIDPASAHLTLKFLGDTHRQRVQALGAAMGAVTASSPAFMLRTAAIGGFPNLRRPSVLWLGLAGSLGHLAALQQGAEAALVGQGFPAETRPFRPHLTIGRLARGTAFPTPAAVATLAASADFSGAVLPVRSIQLIRSELGRGGARYTILYDLPLALADE
ncbi:MAG TPA: RNA 2',3'-cyclic phosphodiesterase [Thermomicrobiales bacterium]|jgi:2'-5' RNA ligase